MQLRATAPDRGQEFFRPVGQDEERGIGRRLLENFQKRVLRRLGHVLLDEVDLALSLVWPEKDVRPHLPDHVDRDRLVRRVVHGDDVRMDALEHLPAALAPPAGLPPRTGTLHRRSKNFCQRVLARAVRPAYQIAVRKPILCRRGVQPRPDGLVAQ